MYQRFIIELASLRYCIRQGRLDKRAMNIPQGCMGYSSKEPLGTSNIRDCVGLLLIGSNGAGGVAHIDSLTDPSTLAPLFALFDEVEAHLIGEKSTDENLEKVTTYLSRCQNTPVAAFHRSSAFTYNPMTKTLDTRSVPLRITHVDNELPLCAGLLCRELHLCLRDEVVYTRIWPKEDSDYVLRSCKRELANLDAYFRNGEHDSIQIMPHPLLYM